MASKRVESDPVHSYRFAVDITNSPLEVSSLYFTELSGLSVEYGLIEHKLYTDKGVPIVQKLPGRITYSPVTLKRGITSDLSMWRWYQLIFEGKLAKARADISITLFNGQYKPIFMWSLMRAWPSKISGFQFSTESNDVIMQELTLVYEHVEEQPV